jgi:hypothetical protein
MPNITPSRKGGTSVDSSDLLAKKKRSIYLSIARNASGKGGRVQQSNRQLGYDNGFMEMHSQRGLDLYNINLKNLVCRGRYTQSPYSVFDLGILTVSDQNNYSTTRIIPFGVTLPLVFAYSGYVMRLDPAVANYIIIVNCSGSATNFMANGAGTLTLIPNGCYLYVAGNFSSISFTS